MPENNNIELRSDEVQEILGHIPSKLIRYGITIIFTVIITVLAGSFFFKYPDIIAANFEIVTQNPPAEIIARSSGNLTNIFITDSQQVSCNQMLGIIQNSAKTKHVLTLNNYMPEIQLQLFNDNLHELLPDTLQLGDLQTYYSALCKASHEYSQFIELNYYESKLEAALQKQDQLIAYIDLLKEQVILKAEELKISKNQYFRDSTLYAKEIISTTDLENSKKLLLQEHMAYRSQKSSVINTQLQLNELKQQIIEYHFDQKKQNHQYKQSLNELYSNLESRIAWWFDQYVLASPINGHVAFNKIWSNNQYIESGSQIFSVIPNKEQNIIGRVTLSSAGVGKIRPKQKVNLKFNKYPYQEFGMVQARVKNISLVPINDEYILEIILPDTLITNYGYLLHFNQKMSGVADIITDDMPLIARLFNPIKDILKSHVGDTRQPEH